MGMGMGNMQKMMKQVQKMQAEVARVQEELGEKTVQGSAGGGVVTVAANGHGEVREVKIDREVIDPEDAEILEDLVLAAVNDALRKAQELSADEMGKVTGGLNLPNIPGLPGF